eukprot:GHVU01081207.1.p1 GENE.GHVU01081207.1~~GHVU01081207.1.p1  ORF type:complete len:162 (-),score=16.63 GHVU01081207.1:1114-1599(-)
MHTRTHAHVHIHTYKHAHTQACTHVRTRMTDSNHQLPSRLGTEEGEDTGAAASAQNRLVLEQVWDGSRESEGYVKQSIDIGGHREGMTWGTLQTPHSHVWQPRLHQQRVSLAAAGHTDDPMYLFIYSFISSSFLPSLRLFLSLLLVLTLGQICRLPYPRVG